MNCGNCQKPPPNPILYEDSRMVVANFSPPQFCERCGTFLCAECADVPQRWRYCCDRKRVRQSIVERRDETAIAREIIKGESYSTQQLVDMGVLSPDFLEPSGVGPATLTVTSIDHEKGVITFDSGEG
ncbi:MAG TPA: hypothetical protein VJS44_08370 [Pyrinomonadaceae bacterium]|nr:hypothetical protein [Pyrinomonadaceae bacterium]